MNQNKQIAIETQKKLSQMVNSYGVDNNSFADAVMNDHRTLQQSTMRLFIACIRKWSDCYENKMYDLRNKETCRLSHKIVNELNDHLFLPFI